MKTDVLVVGAGPVGLTMAAELKRYGLSVRIVEKAAQATDKSKALVIWSRTLELIDRMGCTDSFLKAGQKVTSANISAGHKQVAHFSFDGVDSPHPFGLMIPQSDTERLMGEHLSALGVTVERSVELVSFITEGEGVSATLRHADGREETVASAWLVGCDGAHSTVRHTLGLPFEGDTMPSDWVLADVHLSGPPHPGEVEVFWHPDGVLVLFPIAGDRYRVIADVGDGKSESKQPDPTLDEVQALMDHRGPGGMKASNPIWRASFRINERKVRDYRVGRVFLAGDAAHIHSPAGGQGMNTGMQDACNLAWKLALVQHGLCPEAPLLESYSQERSEVGEQVLKAAGRLTLIGTLRGGVKQAIRNQLAKMIFGLSPVREVMANEMTELSIGYPHSPLSVQGSKVSGAPEAGQRAPLRENELPVGSGSTPRFVLFADSDEQTEALLKQHPQLLEPKLRKPFQPGGLWLVRPDGYVAVATKAGDGDRVESFLKTLVKQEAE